MAAVCGGVHRAKPSFRRKRERGADQGAFGLHMPALARRGAWLGFAR